jgi:asparagine synthase (glutamine-hydrolysing)
MKAIRAFDGLPALTPDVAAIRRYFYLTYLMLPGTVYNEIRLLDAGHFLVVKEGNLRCERWYDLAPCYSEKIDSQAEGIQALRKTMEEAVRDRLVSDVPLGAFLSGGVDSSIVVGMMAKNSRKRVKTFTLGYNDAPLYDESGFAREVARHFQTEHSEIRLSLRDGLAVIPDALDYLDQPFGDYSCIPTYLISRETRNQVTVALSGDGGDEVFAGYSKYQAEAFGLPVVATDVSGVRMLLGGNGEGVVVLPRDEGALASGILEAIAMQLANPRFGFANAGRIKSSFTMGVMCEMAGKAFLSVIRRKCVA